MNVHGRLGRVWTSYQLRGCTVGTDPALFGPPSVYPEGRVVIGDRFRCFPGPSRRIWRPAPTPG